jgi:hypothetical protein
VEEERGEFVAAIALTVPDGLITEVDVVANPAKLRQRG